MHSLLTQDSLYTPFTTCRKALGQMIPRDAFSDSQAMKQQHTGAPCSPYTSATEQPSLSENLSNGEDLHHALYL